MSTAPTQNFKNHTKFDPLFHFFIAPIFLITLIGFVVQAITHPSIHTGWMVIFALGALAAVIKMRVYSLKVQDRLIRLEEKLRLSALMPVELHPTLAGLTEKQLVALRFASDAEAPALAQKAAAENLSPKDIKSSIQSWRPDDFRV